MWTCCKAILRACCCPPLRVPPRPFLSEGPCWSTRAAFGSPCSRWTSAPDFAFLRFRTTASERYWFASPLPGQGDESHKARWIGTEQVALNAQRIVSCVKRPSPLQAERAQLAHGLGTGVMAVDVLAPVGVGQSMLICGPQGTGKSTLAKQVLEHVLTGRNVDKAIRFSCTTAPPVDVALHRSGALEQLAAPALNPEKTAAMLPALFEAVAMAEEVRDLGKHALLVLDTLAPLLDAWDLALQMAEEKGDGNEDTRAAQRRSFFANLLERAANLRRGGALTMLALVETEALAALSVPSAAVSGSKAAESAPSFSLKDFQGRRQSELDRLRRLEERVPLTEQSLQVLGIAPPHRRGGAGKAARELQSLSDGQVILDVQKSHGGYFPAVAPGASFSRFGLGSKSGSETKPRDVRPAALQAVAAHLRTLLALESEAHFRPKSETVDSHQTRQMECVAAALRQPPDAPLLAEEMTALLLAASSGALDPLPLDKASSALFGGARSPLLLHLQEVAPAALGKIREEAQLSQTTLRALEVALRLFVKLKEVEL
ncbi:unnamed protein product [Effrenium voratum]|uniref:AAA+ ATPase domain-containing protein n=1 Tax=Effrenium voratum TaxID=2562239 RepID=A0AA36HXV9_9DINO|nr:unnamed protein product [Effrenium voratum]